MRGRAGRHWPQPPDAVPREKSCRQALLRRLGWIRGIQTAGRSDVKPERAHPSAESLSGAAPTRPGQIPLQVVLASANPSDGSHQHPEAEVYPLSESAGHSDGGRGFGVLFLCPVQNDHRLAQLYAHDPGHGVLAEECHRPVGQGHRDALWPEEC